MYKILFFIPTLMHGGAERVLVNLVNHLDQTKFDISVQTMFDVGIYRNQLANGIKYIPGFSWYFPGNTKIYKLFYPRFLFHRYVKEHYDIIVSYLEGPSARVVAGCDDNRTKLISWVHVEQEKPEYVTQVFRTMQEATECYSRFDMTCCVSKTVKADFQRLFPTVREPKVLYNTVETDVIRSRAMETVDDIVFDKNVINLCSVAKLQYVKGFDRLIRITRKLLDAGLKVHVYIIGKGEEQLVLEKLVAQMQLEEHWTFVGFRENPYKYVANCDLYVCSSRREGFSTAVTEALIVGTPVVSTRCSGAEELLGSHNEYGIVTDNDTDALYQGIKQMISTSGLLEHYSKKTSERGGYFSTENTVKAVEQMLEEVMES